MSDAPPGPSPSRPERRSSRTVEQDREPWPDQEQAFLARLLERLPYPVSYVDAGLVYRCCNAAAAATVGLTREQIIGKTVASIAGADSEVVTLLRRVLESGGPCSGTLELTPPGSTRTLQCHVSYVPDTDGDGRTVGILMNVIDVTELSESEQRFRELVQSMTEGVALHELVYEAGRAVDYRILEANPAFEAQSGISAEAAEGRLASELYGTGEPPYLGEYASVAESGHSISFETYFAPMDRHFRIGVIRPAPGRFATIFEDVTERRQAEAALRESEERSRALFETMQEAFFLYEPVTDQGGRIIDARYLDCNAAAERFVGKTCAELIGRTSAEVLGGSPTRSSMDAFRRVALTGEPTQFTEYSVRLGRWYTTSIFSPWPGQIAMILLDITQQKQAEEAAREREERFRLLHDTMLQGVVYQDAAGTIISMNPAAERILGKGPEDFLGSSSVAVEHETLREDGTAFPGLEHPAMVALRTGKQVPDVLMHIYNPREARYRVIDIQAVPLFRPGERKPYQVYTVFDDVTERRQAEEALKRHAEMLDLSHDAIVVWRLEGTIESWNHGAEELYGFSEAEALGQVSHELLSTVHPQPWPQIEAQLRQRGRWEGEVRHHTKDGRQVIVSSRHQLIRGGDGIERVVETNRDVSESVRAEQGMLDQLATTRALLEAATATAAFDLDTVLLRLVDIMAEQLGRSRVVIHLFEGEREVRTLAATDLRVLRRGQMQPFDHYSVELQNAATAREPTIVDYTQDGMSDLAVRERERLQVEIVLYVPIMLKDRLLGVVTIDEPCSYLPFSARDIELAAALASQAAVAIENTRLYEAETAAQMELAAREERSRLARDLHDSVTQALFAATLKAEALTQSSDSVPDTILQIAEEVRRLNRGALAEMRTLLLELRGDALEDVPIDQLLRHLVEAAEGRSGVKIRLTLRDDEQTPPTLHEPIYRIAQEALNNVTRHAGAAQAWVDLGAGPEEVHLVVGDDGSGFEAPDFDPTHVGLRSMRERAEKAGARFGLVTEVGGGTVITVHWNQARLRRDARGRHL